MSGGVCVPAYTVNFVTPTDGQLFGGPSAANVSFLVTVRRPDGGAPTAASIPFDCSGLTGATSLPRTDAGVYGAQFALPAVTRPFTANAGWDAGPNDSVTFNVDKLAPIITLELPDGGPFIRDAVVPVAIKSTKALNLGSIQLTLTGTNGVVVPQVAPVANSVCMAVGLTLNGSTDRCGTLDFASPVMAGVTASFSANVNATDTVGNPDGFQANLPVTRVRWLRDVGVSGTVVRAAPALDSQGNLFIGTEDGIGLTGRLVSLSPSGATRFSQSVGAVVSLAVSRTNTSSGLGELVYLATTNSITSGSLRTVQADGGTALITAASNCNDPDHRTYSAIGLFDAGVVGGLTEVGAVALFNPNPVMASDPGIACSYAPRTGSQTATGGSSFGQPVPDGTTVISAANIVFDGTKGYVQLNDRSLGYLNVPLNNGGNGGSSASLTQISAQPTGLAISTSAIIASWANTSTVAPVTSYSRSTPNSPNTVSRTGWEVARPPVVTDAALITSTEEPGTLWMTSMTITGAQLSAATGVGSPTSSSFSATSPVLGTGARTYIVRRNGELYVYPTSNSGGIGGAAPLWNGSLFPTAGNVIAHPTLDCSRNGSGLGTLYAVSSEGRVVAVVVDSAKLDDSAPWPKWQRTAGNSGNTTFALNPGCP